MSECILSHCDRPEYAKGLCRMHHHRFGQGIEHWSAPIAAEYRTCTKCDAKHHAKGLCMRHYNASRPASRSVRLPPLQTVSRKRGPKPTFDWAACGTPEQYRKHLRHGIPMCEACRRAENRRTQDSRKKLSKVPRNPGVRLIS